MPLRIDTKTLRHELRAIVASIDKAGVVEWTLTMTFDELRDSLGDVSGLDLPAEHDWQAEGF
jgi:hypothetical protein